MKSSASAFEASNGIFVSKQIIYKFIYYFIFINYIIDNRDISSKIFKIILWYNYIHGIKIYLILTNMDRNYDKISNENEVEIIY